MRPKKYPDSWHIQLSIVCFYVRKESNIKQERRRSERAAWMWEKNKSRECQSTAAACRQDTRLPVNGGDQHLWRALVPARRTAVTLSKQLARFTAPACLGDRQPGLFFQCSRLTIHSLGKDGGSRGYSQRWDALSDNNRFSSPPPTDLLLRMLALNSDDARLALPYLSS